MTRAAGGWGLLLHHDDDAGALGRALAAFPYPVTGYGDAGPPDTTPRVLVLFGAGVPRRTAGLAVRRWFAVAAPDDPRIHGRMDRARRFDVEGVSPRPDGAVRVLAGLLAVLLPVVLGLFLEVLVVRGVLRHDGTHPSVLAADGKVARFVAETLGVAVTTIALEVAGVLAASWSAATQLDGGAGAGRHLPAGPDPSTTPESMGV